MENGIEAMHARFVHNDIEAEALRASIAHWKELVAAEEPGLPPDGRTCALCYMLTCRACPVARVTGKDYCQDTPWKNAWHAWKNWQREASDQYEPMDAKALWRKAAKAELEFLESLEGESKS